MITTIIFDLWRTLATKDTSTSRDLREAFNIPETPDFLKKYEYSIQLKRYDSLRDMTLDFLTAFEVPTSEENITTAISIFEKGMKSARLIPGMYDIASELSKNYKLGILSNTHFSIPPVVKGWDVCSFFSDTIFSFEAGVVKPNPKIFEFACKRLNVKPGEVMFVDDLGENIDAAKEFGMHGVVFKDSAQLREELSSYGVKFD